MLVLLVLLVLPEVNLLVPASWTVAVSGIEVAMNWVVYLSGVQLSLAGMCAMAIWMPRSHTLSVALFAAMVWYLLQSADEWVSGNFFTLGVQWEYAILFFYIAAITFYLYTHERNNRQATGLSDR